MSNVKKLTNPLNLENIPLMLRNLADEIENGEVPQYKAMLVLGMIDLNSSPDVFSWGKEPGRIVELGLLQSAIVQLGQTD